MKCNPERMLKSVLDLATEIIRDAGARPELSLEAASIVYNGALADILDEQAEREYILW